MMVTDRVGEEGMGFSYLILDSMLSAFLIAAEALALARRRCVGS